MESFRAERYTLHNNQLYNGVEWQDLIPDSSSFGADEQPGTRTTPALRFPYGTKQVYHVEPTSPYATKPTYHGRRYSRHWWPVTWNDAVEHRFWPRVIYCSLGLAFVVLWVAVM